MANIAIILGKSGTGKSTSIKTLDPKQTFIINVLGKKLPFKRSSSLYNEANKNLAHLENYEDIINYINSISKNAPNIKTIIIEDGTYIMRKEYFKRAKESGYGKYTELAQHYQNIIQTCEQAREDLNIFFIMHSEEIVSDNNIIGYKVATIGKLLDTQYNPVEVVPMVLYSDIKYNEKGVPTYGFYTHRCKEGLIEIPAKSPTDMFKEDFIPNDLGCVIKEMNEYYQ